VGYQKQVFSGLGWLGLWRGVTRGLAFVKIAIIARVLAPSDYGLFAIAALLLTFLEVFTQTGINVFFVQGEAEIDDYIDTAWVVSVLRGLLIASLIFVSAPLVAIFFSTPQAKGLIYMITLVPLIRGFINPSIAKLQKELEFRKYSYYQISLFVVEAIVTVIMVILTHSALGLVWGMIASSAYDVIFSFVVCSPRPALSFELNKAKHIVGRGKWLTISAIGRYFFEQGDDLLVGRLLGSGSLGIYQMAYKISTLPVTEISDVVGRVTFPVYTKISADKQRLVSAYLKITILIIAASVPFGLFVILFPEFVVNFLLGKQWLDAVSLLRILIVYGVLRSIIANYSALFLAKKRQEYVAMITLVSFLGMAASIFPLILRYGLLGAAWAPLIGTLLTYPFVWYLFKQRLFK
jgi:O-antigen/teichoic acid export membrane protein